MKSFGPPLVGGPIDPWDAGCTVYQDSRFLGVIEVCNNKLRKKSGTEIVKVNIQTTQFVVFAQIRKCA